MFDDEVEAVMMNMHLAAAEVASKFVHAYVARSIKPRDPVTLQILQSLNGSHLKKQTEFPSQIYFDAGRGRARTYVSARLASVVLIFCGIAVLR